MSPQDDEGYEDPYVRNPFRDNDLAELVRLAAKLGWHYHEGGKCDESGIKKWVVGVGIVLTASFILGGWVLSTQVSSLAATVERMIPEQDRRFAEQAERISKLEQRTERGYRDERP